MRIITDIALTDVCNMTCSYCQSKKGSVKVTGQEIEKYLDKYKTSKQTDFVILGGELTTHIPGVTKLVNFFSENKILEKGRDNTIFFYTNAKEYSEVIADVPNVLPHSSIVVSCDNLYRNNPVSERGIDDETLLYNLERYLEKTDRVIIAMTLTANTFSYIFDNIKSLAALGIKQFKIKLERDFSQRIDDEGLTEVLDSIKDQLEKSIDELGIEVIHNFNWLSVFSEGEKINSEGFFLSNDNYARLNKNTPDCELAKSSLYTVANMPGLKSMYKPKSYNDDGSITLATYEELFDERDNH